VSRPARSARPLRLAKPPTEGVLAFDGGTLTRLRLELDDIGVERWTDVGRALADIGQSLTWAIGDWLLYGEQQEWGDPYTEAQTVFGLSIGYLRNCKWVAKSFEISRRRDNLSWAHHREVMGLEPDEQDRWLDRASKNGWTTRELQAWLKGDKPKPLPVHTPLLRFCQNLATPIIVTQILRVYFSDAETALDTTGGDGGFWDGSEHLSVTLLIRDPLRSDGPDFRDLDWEDDSVDVVLMDPPHLADAGADAIMGGRFGTYPDGHLEEVIRDGCREAWRVARLGVIVKVTDHVHAQRYVLESDWVRNAIGREPFDEVYQVRGEAMIDPKWEEQLSAYNNGSTYLIFRKDGDRHVRRAKATA